MITGTELQKVLDRQLPGPPLAAEAQRLPTPFYLIQRALRGRRALAGMLAIFGAGLGWVVGTRCYQPTYRSEGLVRIAYSLPAVMQETDQNGPMGMFDAFLRSQQFVLSSRAVVDVAMEKPAWKAIGRAQTPATFKQFIESLNVQHPINTQDLHVTFTDADPYAAAAAVRSIIQAYTDFYNNDVKQMERQRLQTLEDRRKDLDRQLKSLRVRLKALAEEFGTINLDRLYEASVAEFIKLESKLTDARLAAAVIRRIDASGIGASPPALDTGNANLPLLREYIARQERLQDSVDDLKIRGFLDTHPAVIRLKQAVENARQRVNVYMEASRKLGPVTIASASNPEVPAMALAADEASIKKLYDEARQKMLALGSKRVQIEHLRLDEDNLQKELEQTTRRLQVLQVEASVGDRLAVISTGEVPISPFQDRRPIFGAVGSLAGACLPMGMLVFFGLSRPRVRFSDETGCEEARGIPLLGMIPKLSNRLTQESAGQAARSIHLIRTMLQAERGGPRTFMITSASPGDGKTSMTAALALSFAASGARTLLIDCDLVGRQVTRGFGMEGRPGLYNAMGKPGLAECVESAIGGLWVLPAGNVNGTSACALAGPAVRRLIGEAREEFDIVLIDTGPVLASVEAMVVAPEVEGVIVVVSRGQRRFAAERAMRQLAAVQARIAGVIFNRSQAREFHESIPSSSPRLGVGRQAWHLHKRPGLPDLGPIVASVAAFLPNRDEIPPSLTTGLRDSARIERMNCPADRLGQSEAGEGQFVGAFPAPPSVYVLQFKKG